MTRFDKVITGIFLTVPAILFTDPVWNWLGEITPMWVKACVPFIIGIGGFFALLAITNEAAKAHAEQKKRDNK
jgi:hypothetical protein